MQLGLTIPLQRRLHIRSLPPGSPADRNCWDLHIISLRGEDSLLLVHCATRYTIVARGVTAPHLRETGSLAMEQIRAGLLDAGLPGSTVARYLREAGAAQLTRTHGRREVAFLNRAWEDVMALDFAVDLTALRQPLLERAVNDIPCRCAGFPDRDTARAFLGRIIF